MRAQKSDRSRFLLMLVREDRTDEGQELFVGIGVGELGSPTLVEFHKTRMRPVAIDKLRLTTGVLPNGMLDGLVWRERILVIVPFVLKKDLVGTGSDYFSREGVTEVFLFGNCNVVNTLFGGFLEGTGDRFDAVTDSEFCHSSIVNN